MTSADSSIPDRAARSPRYALSDSAFALAASRSRPTLASSAFSPANAAASLPRTSWSFLASSARRRSHCSFASAAFHCASFPVIRPASSFMRNSTLARLSPSPVISWISPSTLSFASLMALCFSNIALPRSEYFEVSVSFSRISAFSSGDPRRNLVN